MFLIVIEKNCMWNILCQRNRWEGVDWAKLKVFHLYVVLTSSNSLSLRYTSQDVSQFISLAIHLLLPLWTPTRALSLTHWVLSTPPNPFTNKTNGPYPIIAPGPSLALSGPLCSRYIFQSGIWFYWATTRLLVSPHQVPIDRPQKLYKIWL